MKVTDCRHKNADEVLEWNEVKEGVFTLTLRDVKELLAFQRLACKNACSTASLEYTGRGNVKVDEAVENAQPFRKDKYKQRPEESNGGE